MDGLKPSDIDGLSIDELELCAVAADMAAVIPAALVQNGTLFVHAMSAIHSRQDADKTKSLVRMEITRANINAPENR